MNVAKYEVGVGRCANDVQVAIETHIQGLCSNVLLISAHKNSDAID